MLICGSRDHHGPCSQQGKKCYSCGGGHLARVQNIPNLTATLNGKFNRFNTIAITICQEPMRALIDSGASISCISSNALRRVDATLLVRIQPAAISHAKGVNQTLISILGVIMLPVNISGVVIVITQLFHVLENMTAAVKLGMNFLQDNETVIDLDAKILVINVEVKVPLTEGRNLKFEGAREGQGTSGLRDVYFWSNTNFL